jgi:ABC-type amino acid transport substrate-binding protein
VTRPYYRSTYVFVYRRDAGLSIRSFDDSVLRSLRIGVQIIGDDYANTPPAHALSRRGVVGNLKGYTVYGDYREANPPARIIDAVVDRDVDIAIAWGPLAGYFAQHSPVPLEVVPVSPQIDLPFLPFVYDIAVGVKRGNDSLRIELDSALVRRRADIDRLLMEFGVPRVGVVRSAMGG